MIDTGPNSFASPDDGEESTREELRGLIERLRQASEPLDTRRIAEHDLKLLEPRDPRIAAGVHRLRAVSAAAQGDHLRFGPHAARRTGLQTGRGAGAEDGRTWLVCRHGRGDRHHGGRAPRGGPQPFDGPQHHAAVRAGIERDHPRRPQARDDEILLHAQADVREGMRRGGLPAGRLWHARRGDGGAHAAANRQARADAGGAARRAGRHLLARLGRLRPAKPARRRR